MPIVECKNCTEKFSRCSAHLKRGGQFCSKKCSGIFTRNNHKKYFIKCDYCKVFFRSFPCYEKRNYLQRFCNKKCEAKAMFLNNTENAWKGGTIAQNGYKYITINGKQVEEHRLVMQRHLKRKLQKNEHIHHINHIKTDNRIENLLLLTNSEHGKLHAKIKQIRKQNNGD